MNKKTTDIAIRKEDVPQDFFNPKSLLPLFIENRLSPKMILRIYAIITHYRIATNISAYHKSERQKRKSRSNQSGNSLQASIFEGGSELEKIAMSLVLIQEDAKALLQNKYNVNYVASFLKDYPLEAGLSSYVGSQPNYIDTGEELFFETYPIRKNFSNANAYQKAVNVYNKKNQAHQKKLKLKEAKAKLQKDKQRQIEDRSKIRAAYLESKQEQAAFKKNLPYFQKLLSEIIKGASLVLGAINASKDKPNIKGIYLGKGYKDKPLGEKEKLSLYFSQNYKGGVKRLDDRLCALLGNGSLAQSEGVSKMVSYFASQVKKENLPQSKHLFSGDRVFIDQVALNNHVVGIGGSGSGKTELITLMIESIIKQYPNSPMLVIEPHGTLCEPVARLVLSKQQKDRIVYLSGRYLQKGHRFCYNPLAFEHQDKASLSFTYRDALSKRGTNLKHAFGVALPKGEFSTQMQNLLYNCLVVLLDTDNTSIANLIEMMRVEGKGEMKSPYREIVNEFFDEDVRAYFAHTFCQNTLLATRNAVVSRLDGLFSNESSKSLFYCSESSFDVKDLLSKNKIILVSAEKMNFTPDAIKLLGSMLTTEYDEWLDVRALRFGVEGNPNAYLFLDEAGRFLTPHIAEMADERRKFGAAMCIFAQRKGQFSSEVWEALTTNANTFLVGRGGGFDKIGKECRIEGVCLKGQVGEFAMRDFKGQSKRLLVDSRLVFAKKDNAVFDQYLDDGFVSAQLKRYYTSVERKKISLPIPVSKDAESTTKITTEDINNLLF